MVTKAQVMKALSKVMDPELGISVVDMGFIRKLTVSKDKVSIVMILTSPFCPMASLMIEGVKKAAKIKGVKQVNVKLDIETPWNPTMMKPSARKKIGL